ncbi:uncharacterized protein Tco025E_07406 [Trypanosoma conorhini]|uniref:Uncharacterized protein n=1 Tax=Trypanosoma conorhini TaxID=83891 RepID=A0A422NQ64_9TRYP|nr:uncharacterized protein Tco025E_07406 [Trypanosoma conorhini]RNF07623.1 hypothetical protein Tco025E_07406 [Trypanosoma conorhini]
MEVLKELPKSGLDALRKAFLLRERVGGLTAEEFEEALFRVCDAHETPTTPADAELRKVFASIDVLGLGRISWDAFSMYAIDSLRGRVHRVVTGGEAKTEEDEDEPFRPFHVEQLMSKVHAGCVHEVRMLPVIDRVMLVTTAAGGRCTMNLCEAAQNLPLSGIIRLESGVPLAWEFVPQKAGGGVGSSVACSHNGGLVQFFSTAKRSRLHRYLDKYWQMSLAETQSALHWVPCINRLAMGSRGGLVTLWDMQDQTQVLRRRLTQKCITSMQSWRQLLYVASLDAHAAVQCLDLEHNTVQYTFNDHSMGGAMQLLVDDNFMFSSGFGRGIVQRVLALPKSRPVALYDAAFPHQGCITALERLSGTPLLVSGDAQGNLKFWDLRMGACVQTIRGRKAPAGGDSHTLPAVVDGTHAHSAAPVRSICHLDFFGKLVVATAKELLVVTSDASICPALVDDSHVCRSVFFPNPEFFLTVHLASVKLWCISTGMLVRCSEPNITKFEVTSCCMVEPLNQQLLLGTVGGEVAAFSVVLLQLTVNLTPAIEPYIRGTEVTALHTVPRYRGRHTPYVLVATSSTLLLAPVHPACGPESVIGLQGIVHRLLPWKQTIKALTVTETHFILATSDARVHCVTYRDQASLTHTFHMSAAVEAIVARPALMLRRPSEAGTTPKGVQSSEVVVFFADFSGRVHIATIRRGFPGMRGKHATGELVGPTEQRGRHHSQFFGEVIGSWLPHKRESWVEGGSVEALRQQDPGPFPVLSRARPSFSVNCAGNPSHSLNTEPRVGTPGMPALDTVTGRDVSIVLLEQYSVLVTADDEGIVRLWDVGSAVAHCLDEEIADPPVLITLWRLLDREVIFFGTTRHPTLNLPLLLAATGDLVLTIWSADGAVLGTLSTGREVDEASGGRRFGLLPYKLLSPDTTGALWAKFLAYMERAAAAEAAPVSRLRASRRSTFTPSILLRGEAAVGQRLSQINAPRSQRPSCRPLPSIFLPHLVSATFTAFSRTPRDSVCPQSSIHPGKDKIGDPKTPSRSIVKPSYQGLITRTTSPFSLRRTGATFPPH